MSEPQARTHGLVADVRSVSLRGEWNVLNMLSDQSIKNVLSVWSEVKGF